jgi:hypothetical protein
VAASEGMLSTNRSPSFSRKLRLKQRFVADI